MKLKKINAALGLLSVLFMLLHVAYSAFAYLTMYYNPVLKTVFSVPFIVLVCLHAVCGMMSVLTHQDGSRLDLYPKQNAKTLLQRLSAALIFPLLILHLYTFRLMQACADRGTAAGILLLMLAELLFFGVVMTHIAVSVSGGLITLGLLSSDKKRRSLDKTMYILGAIAFLAAAFSVLRGQATMFLH